jgi:hypothetical protein
MTEKIKISFSYYPMFERRETKIIFWSELNVKRLFLRSRFRAAFGGAWWGG